VCGKHHYALLSFANRAYPLTLVVMLIIGKHSGASHLLREDLLMRFTRQSVAALSLPLEKAEHVIWDDTLPGFGLRIRSGGKRWIVQFRGLDGKSTKRTLGSPDVVAPDAARAAALPAFKSAMTSRGPRREAGPRCADIRRDCRRVPRPIRGAAPQTEDAGLEHSRRPHEEWAPTRGSPRRYRSRHSAGCAAGGWARVPVRRRKRTVRGLV
jgi:Arm DNA-binding domain